MIIRVQTTGGMKKINIQESASLKDFRDILSKELSLAANLIKLSRDRSGGDVINLSQSMTIKKSGLKHGDLLHLIGVDTRASVDEISSNGNISQPKLESKPSASNLEVYESELDRKLEKMDGKIARKRNAQYCSHPLKGLCIHCSPVEPGDPAYLDQFDPPVKFLPFHAHIKKLQKSSPIANCINLENLNCLVKPGCLDHPPWPEGICTKCQPKPVTLSRQSYRHCDYVQFENPQIIDDFLDYWRVSGSQRIGILIGRYSLLDTPGSSPLAIKSTVTAIFEPEQESTSRSVKITCPLNEMIPKPVCQMIKALGWEVVGWIFTDLLAEDPTVGTVKHYRGTMDTYFLSAMECVTAAHLQNAYPNTCKYSSDGVFGSKFATVVATGDKENQIHFEAYQVSNQAMALCRDNILVPTHDAPELGYIKETTKEQFVPEVFYSCTDEYKNQVTKVGRPLPIEYLLIDMPVGFPKDSTCSLMPMPLILYQKKSSLFPIENRERLGKIQDVNAFATFYKYVSKKCPDLSDPSTLCLANFHVLVWLSQLDLGVTTTRTDGFNGLLDAIRTYISSKSVGEIEAWIATSPFWHAIMEKIAAIDDSPAGVPMDTDEAGSSGTVEKWSCPHCTYENTNAGQECEMCCLPRAGGH